MDAFMAEREEKMRKSQEQKVPCGISMLTCAAAKAEPASFSHPRSPWPATYAEQENFYAAAAAQ
jgi:hypothetical protein